jgi:site-specific DNA-cytosine methylase
MKEKILKFIDLFAGLGGIRLGFEEACREKGIKTECVLTSEIKLRKTTKSFFYRRKIAYCFGKSRHNQNFD